MKFDAQHITLLIVALISAFGPAIAASVSAGTAAVIVAALSGLVIIANSVLSLFKTSPKDSVVVNAVKMLSTPPPPMPPPSLHPPTAMVGVVVFLAALSTVRMFSGCTALEAKTALDTVLSLSQLACIEATQLSTSQEVMVACKIDAQMAPGLQAWIDQLLAQKMAAQRAGFQWHSPTDAGTP